MLAEHEHDGNGGRCQECNKAIAAGPCAACEAMICADCCVMSRDPSGQRVICISCARLVADVAAHPKRRWMPSNLVVAIVLLTAIATGVAALALR